jgi:hypothetical protein
MFLAACTVVGAVVYNGAPTLGNVLMAATSVGYYPSGADVPLGPGLGVWGVSVVALTFAGLMLGSFVGRVARPQGGETNAASDIPEPPPR